MKRVSLRLDDLKAAIPFTCSDDKSPIGCIQVKREGDRMRIGATDGYALIVLDRKLPEEVAIEDNQAILIPRELAEVIAKYPVPKSKKTPMPWCEFEEDGNYITGKIGSTELTVAARTDAFPPIGNIIPTGELSPVTQVGISLTILDRFAKAAKLLSGQEYVRIEFTGETKQMIITVHDHPEIFTGVQMPVRMDPKKPGTYVSKGEPSAQATSHTRDWCKQHIGSTPNEEDCAQVGEDNYSAKARKECQAYIEQIRRFFGKEPNQSALVIDACPHDFGTYYEVAYHYDANDQEHVKYAEQIQNGMQEWDEEAKQALNLVGK